MSNHVRRTALSLLFALAFVGGANADPNPLYPPLLPVSGVRPLEHGNGNKIVVSSSNVLHAVYVSFQSVFYTTSEDGESWTYPVSLGRGSYPAIAVDDNGTVGVVFLGDWISNDQGWLVYRYKPANGSWVYRSLNATGTEPSLVASGNLMYLAWSTIKSIRYASFPSLTPPASLPGPSVPGTIVEETSCGFTGYRRPAIALVRDPCGPPMVSVGFLFYSDEQSSSSCSSPITRVGPRVAQRNNATSSWSNVFDGTISSSLPTSSVSVGAFSMDANFWRGNTLLAWSDVQDGVARSRLARPANGSWLTWAFPSQFMHVHVRSSGPRRPSQEFRLAWTASGSGPDPLLNNTSRRAVLSWTSATPSYTPIPLAPNDVSVGHPQAIRWARCGAGEYVTTDAFFEVTSVSLPRHVATDLGFPSSCPPEVAYPQEPCIRPGFPQATDD